MPKPVSMRDGCEKRIEKMVKDHWNLIDDKESFKTIIAYLLKELGGKEQNGGERR